jgi:hypothetical protein
VPVDDADAPPVLAEEVVTALPPLPLAEEEKALDLAVAEQALAAARPISETAQKTYSPRMLPL